jgi:hypothetical protein
MQLTITRLSLFATLALALAGCATPNPNARHLVYRDASGNAFRQFDYPDNEFCRRVEASAGRSTRCEAAPASGLQARATLRYTPPGVLVEGHYADMARCRADTSSMATGVALVNPCAPTK